MECFIYPLKVLHIFTGGTARKQQLEREGPMKKSKCDWTNALSVKSKKGKKMSSLSLDPVGISVMLPIGWFLFSSQRNKPHQNSSQRLFLFQWPADNDSDGGFSTGICVFTLEFSAINKLQKLGTHLDSFETVGVTSRFNHYLKCRLVLPSG